MARLTITIDLDNAAFDRDPPEGFESERIDSKEVGRILRRAVTFAEALPFIALDNEWPLLDANGNTVGSMATEEDSS